jgi:phosphomethylpyrimidine synthase
MSRIKVSIKNRRTGQECLCGGRELVAVFPYGLSPLASSNEEELKKVRLAERLGVDMIKDNSVGRKEWFRLLKSVSEEINLPLGASATLAAGNLAIEAGKRPTDITKELLFRGFEKLTEVCDAIEVFPTITKKSLKILLESQRVIKTVISRAGNIIAHYIQTSGCENPFYTDFDWFLDQAKEKEITLIFGNGLRAACLADAFDEVQMYEIELVKELAQKAVDKNVRVIAGIFGHIDPSKTEFFKKVREEIPIPIGGLGPLSTDIALGYDHINAAISLVMFREYFDWVSIITPAEHIGMPSFSDASDGITAFNIARHILDLKEGRNQEKDLRMAKARMNKLWCAGMPEIALNPYSPAIARVAKEKWPDGCTLCGDWCPFVTKRKKEGNKKD